MGRRITRHDDRLFRRMRTEGNMEIHTFRTKRETSEAAASEAAQILRDAIAARGKARMVVSTGNSQFDFIEALTAAKDVNWRRVEALHLDEYAGMPMSHPASFRLWLKMRVADRVPLLAMQYLNGDAPDTAAECRRYAALLEAEPVDVGLIGIGENGHIAFNDPPVADFQDPVSVKRVLLDEACRLQQVGEGHFPNLDAAPREALTVTCPAILRMKRLVCVVPERRKAEAVRCALRGPVTTACPASVLRNHPRASLYLDQESASLLD